MMHADEDNSIHVRAQPDAVDKLPRYVLAVMGGADENVAG